MFQKVWLHQTDTNKYKLFNLIYFVLLLFTRQTSKSKFLTVSVCQFSTLLSSKSTNNRECVQFLAKLYLKKKKKVRSAQCNICNTIISRTGECMTNMIKYLRIHGAELTECPVFDMLCRPSSNQSKQVSKTINYVCLIPVLRQQTNCTADTVGQLKNPADNSLCTFSWKDDLELKLMLARQLTRLRNVLFRSPQRPKEKCWCNKLKIATESLQYIL